MTVATGGRVLIIDDEASLRHTLTRILKQIGCEVTSAADGPEALQRLALEGSRQGAAPYDLAYLDIHLPGMDGLQVLKEVHRLYPHMPVVLFTAYGSLQSALTALRLGASDYLLKPVDPETLVARTRVILAERAMQRRRIEIREQIDALQSELKSLDASAAPSPASLSKMPQSGAPRGTAAAPPEDRFVKRGAMILDLHARRATLGARVLMLPPAAFDYLLVLVRHAPDVVAYQTLVVEAHGADHRQAQELAKWHIHELREAIEPDPKRPQHVLNVRGTGYRLLVDTSAASASQLSLSIPPQA